MKFQTHIGSHDFGNCRRYFDYNGHLFSEPEEPSGMGYVGIPFVIFDAEDIEDAKEKIKEANWLVGKYDMDPTDLKELL